MAKHHLHSRSFDLSQIAHQAMLESGFSPDMPPSVIAELATIKTAPDRNLPSVRDLRSLLWSSIDDAKTRDLDQVEYVEPLPDGKLRVLVGIADVDARVAQDSATDAQAKLNTTSIYTGVRTFPMLPEELSTDLTSLRQDADRTAIVTEMLVGTDGNVQQTEVYQAQVRNYGKLSYEAVGAWLDGHGEIPATVAETPKLETQIRLQSEAAKHLRELRRKNGALELETIQATPVINHTGQITDLASVQRNGARDLIENFMIAANVAMAEFLEAKGVACLRRVVHTPKYWSRIVEIARDFGEVLPAEPNSRALADFMLQRKADDPLHFPDLSLSVVKLLGPGEYTVQTPDKLSEGHFGLAVNDYTHSTAPNRRYADLVTQRLVKAALIDASAPYSADELRTIAAHCTEREGAARKVERKMRKAAAAVLLSDRIGSEFTAIVTGVSEKGTFVRLIEPIADGIVRRGQEGLRVGDKVRVQLLSTDPERGFIDFARVAKSHG